MLAKFHTEVRPLNGSGKITVVVIAPTRKGVVDRALELGWDGDPADAFTVITHVEEVPGEPTADEWVESEPAQ
jgi:hypothetical protein